MLTILVEGVDPIPDGMDKDIERVFSKTHLAGDAIEQSLIQDIERGEYLDEYSFIDCMGLTLDKEYLSTGCKAAICVHRHPDVPLCCIEAGDNALEAIITHCTDGLIYIPNRRLCFVFDASTDINIMYKGQHYSSLDEFENYMQNEWE
ncbi:MAG: hypothetical protein RSB39_03000 [Oscillospiraceae bacterium]